MKPIFKRFNISQPLFLAIFLFIFSCNTKTDKNANAVATDSTVQEKPATYDTSFIVEAESFEDLQILRYQVPGFNDLSLPQKQLAYY